MSYHQLNKIPSCLKEQEVTKLFYKGNTKLLLKPKISIVGSRKPNEYTKTQTILISQEFAKRDYVVVSGGAMGVDACAHKGAFPSTIAVMANSLDITYPMVNKNLINNIYKDALALSEYEEKATRYSFVHRNRIVVALGEILIVTWADKNSGSLRSVEYALDMGKKIFVLPHRIGDSVGTNELLNKGLATPIYDVRKFVENYTGIDGIDINDDILEFCKNGINLDLALEKFGDKIYEYELDEKISIDGVKVTTVF